MGLCSLLLSALRGLFLDRWSTLPDGSPAPFYNTLPSGGSIASVFTAKANTQGGEELKAVSLAIYDVNVDYSIQISARLAGRGHRLARCECRLSVRSVTSFAPSQKIIARPS